MPQLLRNISIVPRRVNPHNYLPYNMSMMYLPPTHYIMCELVSKWEEVLFFSSSSVVFIRETIEIILEGTRVLSIGVICGNEKSHAYLNCYKDNQKLFPNS